MRVPVRVFLRRRTRAGVHRLVRCCLPAVLAIASAVEAAARPQESGTRQVRVFLDCMNCFSDFLRAEVAFVRYVRDRVEADVHVLITRADTAGGGREHALRFVGAGRFDGVVRTIRTVTEAGDTEDVVRRQLANALRVGLLHYVAREEVPSGLALSVSLGAAEETADAAGDRWNHWVFSVRGSASFDGEESSRESQLGGSVSADRITPSWKITLAGEIDHETEHFDLDEEEPFSVSRREREMDWLAVRGLGEHWSIGATGEIESSTFENRQLAVAAAPAIEYNVFPYSMYTRRQLRALYAVGGEYVQYYEETLFGRLEETLPAHSLAVAYEQREPWGSLGARAEWSQYLHERDKTRLEMEGEFSVRLVRGLSVAGQLTASRIRDQLSLPARGATPEEVLLRIRRLQSGYEYRLGMSLTYTFGSIFSSIVNPRFGR